MTDFDWKGVVQKVAPTIAQALGGPLVGHAVSILGEAILGDSSASKDAVEAALSRGVTPEQLLSLKQAENDFQLKMKELGLKERDLLFQNEQAYLADTQDARKSNAGNRDVVVLGIVILISMAVITLLAIWGSYALITGGIAIKDAATVGMVSGFIGTLVGYVASYAQQVVSFFFGSSKGSDRKTEALADAFKTLR